MKSAWIRLAATLALGSGFLLTGGCSTPDPVTGKGTYNVYSLEDDVALGQSTLKANTQTMVKDGVPVNRDSVRVKQLNTMMNRIASVSHLPDLPYNITLYQTNIVNAAAAPGGSLMVFSGLYDATNALVRDEDELAAVMAHEVAHVTCRHVTERLSKSQSINVVSQLGSVVAGVLGYGNAYDLAQNVFVVSSAIWIPAYSRKDEAEADRVGIFYMADAGYDPEAAIRLWKRAAEQESGDALSLFSTHPSSGNRAEALLPLLPRAKARYKKSEWYEE